MSVPLGYPFNTVVYITFTLGNQDFQASGVLITPDEVLTASHVITSTSQGTSSNIQVTPAYVGSTASGPALAPYGTSSVGVTHYNKILNLGDVITNEQSQNDYAVIHLQHAFDGIGTMSLLANWPGGMANEAGYPGSASGVQKDTSGIYTKESGVTLFTSRDTGSGSSGGPVYIDQGFGPQVVGLVSAGDGTTGFFPIITSTVLAKIQEWVTADDGPAVASKLTDVSAAGFVYDIKAYEKRALIGSQPPIVFSDQTPRALSLAVADIAADKDALRLVAAQFSIDVGTVAAITSVPAVRAAAIGTNTNLTAVQFADGRLVYDANDAAAKINRLYGAAFGRAGDERGLTVWTAQLQAGTPEAPIANSFVTSTEFQARYGASLSDNAFVTQLYANVLNRAPDAPGLAAWDSRLASGVSRGDVLTGFSESSEYIGATAATDQAGIFVLDAAAPEVARLYEAVLARLPDAGGLRFFDNSIDRGGVSLLDVTRTIMASNEYLGRFGNLSTSDFVTDLYSTTLHRAPDAAGAASWNAQLNSGAVSRAQVAVGFSESVEHSIASAGKIFGPTGVLTSA